MTVSKRVDGAFFQAALTAHRLVAVIRSGSADAALVRAKNAVDAGVGVLEIAWTTPNAASVVEQFPGRVACLGAGTILTPAQADEAHQAGAQFFMGPNYSPDVAERARSLGVLYIPGVLTPRDVAEAVADGHRILKLFPAGSTGPAHLKAISEPFPGLTWIPTGGVSWMNAAEWLEAGAAGVGMGTALFDTADLSSAVARLTEKSGW